MFVCFILGILLGAYVVKQKLIKICNEKVVRLENMKKEYKVRQHEYNAKLENTSNLEMQKYYQEELQALNILYQQTDCAISDIVDIRKKMCG